jgi:hypothetical protein
VAIANPGGVVVVLRDVVGQVPLVSDGVIQKELIEWVSMIVAAAIDQDLGSDLCGGLEETRHRS